MKFIAFVAAENHQAVCLVGKSAKAAVKKKFGKVRRTNKVYKVRYYVSKKHGQIALVKVGRFSG